MNRFWRRNESLERSIERCIYHHVLQATNVFIKISEQKVLVGALKEDNTFVGMNKCHNEGSLHLRKECYQCVCGSKANQPKALTPRHISPHKLQGEKDPCVEPEGKWFLLEGLASSLYPLTYHKGGSVVSPSLSKIIGDDGSMSGPGKLSVEDWNTQVYISSDFAAFSPMYEGMLAAAVRYYLIIPDMHSHPRRPADPSIGYILFPG